MWPRHRCELFEKLMQNSLRRFLLEVCDSKFESVGITAVFVIEHDGYPLCQACAEVATP
jgi:hypothetical protein